MFEAEVGLFSEHSAALHFRNPLGWGFLLMWVCVCVFFFYSALGGPRLMGQLSAPCSPAHRAFDSPLKGARSCSHTRCI